MAHVTLMWSWILLLPYSSSYTEDYKIQDGNNISNFGVIKDSHKDIRAEPQLHGQSDQFHKDYGFLSVTEMSAEKRLMRDLMVRYRSMGKEGRPVKNFTHPVLVQFGLGLIKMELQEKENMLSLSTWARYRWKDEYLVWNADEYEGVTSVKISHEEIWTPDIMLYNTANAHEKERKVRVVVLSDGWVSWYPHKVFQSSCAIDVRDFPFDNQTCYLWFGSWTQSVKEVDLDLAFPGGLDLATFKSVYKDSCEWDIYNTSAERIIQPEGDVEDGDRYAILSFTIRLRRKLMFSTYILTMPAIFLGFLTLLEFWLPPEHQDKTALGLTIFGSLLLLLLILVEAAPPTASAVPLLGIYYCFTTVIVILSIFLSSLVVKIGRSSDNRSPVPSFLRMVIIQGLGRVLLLKPPGGWNCCDGEETPSRASTIRFDSSEKEPLTLNGVESNTIHTSTTKISNFDYKINSFEGSLHKIEKRIRIMHDMFSATINRKLEHDYKELRKREIDYEWRHLAMILDRLFFVSYLTVIIGSLVLLFPRRVVPVDD